VPSPATSAALSARVNSTRTVTSPVRPVKTGLSTSTTPSRMAVQNSATIQA
jgi:hypothetical protein